MYGICCDHCGKAVEERNKVPCLYSVWKRFPHGKIAGITVGEDYEPLFARYSLYCATCGKEGKRGNSGGAELCMVLRFLPTGEQEDIYVCEECRPLFDDQIKYLFTILGGPTYTDENQPPAWFNPIPCYYQGYHPSHRELRYVRLHDPERYADVVKEFALDTTQFPLDDFPLIEDFEVILHTGRMKHHPEEKAPRYLIFAFSPSLGYLALLDYSFYLPQYLCQPDFTIPHGDFALPYTEFEQGWTILLTENERFVYILTGNGLPHEGYTSWFKVEKSHYYSQWERVIQLCRSVWNEAEAQ